jgi:hypothetical protein
VGVTDDKVSGSFTLTNGEFKDTTAFTTPVHNYWSEMMETNMVAIAAAEIGGQSFTPGTRYYDTINIGAGTAVILDGQGDPNSVFHFQSGSTMLTGAHCSILLTGGAKAENVFWALGSALTTGANNVFEGDIVAGTVVTIGLESEVNGSVIAKGAITFGAKVNVGGCVIGTKVTFDTENSVSVSPYSCPFP